MSKNLETADESDMRADAPASRPRAAEDDAGAAEVFFDGACPLCRNEIAVYKKVADEQVAWRDVSAIDETGVGGVARADLLARFHVRRRDGRLVSGFPAFMAVWRTIPRLAWLGRALDRQPFHWFGDRIYSLFLWVRPLWRRAR